MNSYRLRLQNFSERLHFGDLALHSCESVVRPFTKNKIPLPAHIEKSRFPRSAALRDTNLNFSRAGEKENETAVVLLKYRTDDIREIFLPHHSESAGDEFRMCCCYAHASFYVQYGIRGGTRYNNHLVSG